MRKSKVKKDTPSTFRQKDGRFRKGHKLGGRGSRSGALTEAFADAGLSLADVRRLVLEQTVANARKGVDSAVARLAALVLPTSRLTPGVLKSAATARERASAVVAAVETGAITAQEAAVLAKGALEHLAQAEEWKDIADKLDRLGTGPAAPALPAVRVVHVEGAVLPTASRGEVVDVDPSNGNGRS